MYLILIEILLLGIPATTIPIHNGTDGFTQNVTTAATTTKQNVETSKSKSDIITTKVTPRETTAAVNDAQNENSSVRTTFSTNEKLVTPTSNFITKTPSSSLAYLTTKTVNSSGGYTTTSTEKTSSPPEELPSTSSATTKIQTTKQATQKLFPPTNTPKPTTTRPTNKVTTITKNATSNRIPSSSVTTKSTTTPSAEATKPQTLTKTATATAEVTNSSTAKNTPLTASTPTPPMGLYSNASTTFSSTDKTSSTVNTANPTTATTENVRTSKLLKTTKIPTTTCPSSNKTIASTNTSFNWTDGERDIVTVVTTLKGNELTTVKSIESPTKSSYTMIVYTITMSTPFAARSFSITGNTSDFSPTSLPNKKTTKKTDNEVTTNMMTDSPVTAPKPIFFCPETWVKDERKGSYHFPKKDIFEWVTHSCQHGTSNFGWKVKRMCEFNNALKKGYWGKIDLTFCYTSTREKGIILEIENNKVTIENAVERVNYISTTLNNNKNLVQTKLDFQVIVNATQDIVQVTSTPLKTEFLSKVMTIVGNLMKVKKKLLTRKTRQQIDDIFIILTTRFDQSIRSRVSVDSTEIALVLQKATDRDPVWFTTRKQQPSGNIGILNKEEDEDGVGGDIGENVLKLPESVFSGISPPITSVLLTEMVPTTNMMPPLTNQTVISNILSATVLTTSKAFNDLVDPVELKFQVGHHGSNAKISCRFWNESLGRWATDGCDPADWDPVAGSVSCKCYHLTSFAVVMETIEEREVKGGDESGDKFMLHIFAFIGSFIAVLALGITLITYLCIKSIRKHVNSKAIACFCVSLIFTIIAFVAGITFVKQPMTCFIVGRILHYFVLTSFCWMLIQAINLYRAIVVISVRRTDGNYFKWMSLLAWGVPLIIIGITAYFSYQTQLQQDYKPDICFVENSPFYCSVLLPSIVLIVSNFAMFVPIFRNIIHCEELIKDSIENRKHENARRAKSTITVAIVCTLVWTVAVLSGILKVSALQYFFYALLPVLGIVVCIFYVVQNVEAKKGWQEMFPCCKRKEEAIPGEMVKLRSKKNLLDSADDREKRISIVINGDLYGYGTETFDGTPKSRKKLAQQGLDGTPKSRKKLDTFDGTPNSKRKLEHVV